MIHADRKPTQKWAYSENKLFMKTWSELFFTIYIILSSF